MQYEHKKTILIVGTALFFVWLFRNNHSLFGGKAEDLSDRATIPAPKINPNDLKGNAKAKNAFIALKAYIAAWNNKENQKKLDELNCELKKEMKVTVTQRKSDGKFIVEDLEGKLILVN